MIKPAGWNTWDVEHLNAIVYLPDRLRVCFSLFNLQTQVRKAVFDWRTGLRRLGPHASDGSYSQIDLAWDDLTVSFEYSQKPGKRLPSVFCRVNIAEDSFADLSSFLLLVEMDGAWGEPVQVELYAAGLVACASGRTWQLTASRAPLPTLPAFLRPGSPILAFPLLPVGQEQMDEDSDVCTILVKVEPGYLPIISFEDEVKWIEEQRSLYLQTSLRTSGWLMDAASGMTRGLHWNTIWEPIKKRICSPVSRDWCRHPNWGGYVLFDWDTFFAALMSTLEDPSLAQANLRAILQEVTPNGFVPNFGSARSASLDRSQPPVGAYVALKISRSRSWAADRAGDEMVAEIYPQLLRWHRWWLPHRDGNGDGLLEWGSDPLEGSPVWGSGTLRDAMYESGLDNSPMYDEATYNYQTHTMELADVGLNALYALDSWALAEMAGILSITSDVDTLTREYQQMTELINRELWNEAAGIYQNKFWDGRFSPALSPTNFYPLLAGVVPPDRARRMVNDHLLNPKEFWSGFGLPSISRSDPGYRSSERLREGLQGSVNDYWRGRIWGPMNFLVCEGLRRYGFDLESQALARRSIDLFLGEWRGESHIHENYDDVSGDGDNVPNSDPVYHWGGLLAYLGIQELVDYEPWKGWRFGNLGDGFASVKGVHLNEGSLDVAISPAGLRLTLNNTAFLATDQPCILRGVHFNPGGMSGYLTADSPMVDLTLFGLLPGQRVAASTGGQSIQLDAASDGQIALSLASHSHFELSWPV